MPLLVREIRKLPISSIFSLSAFSKCGYDLAQAVQSH